MKPNQVLFVIDMLNDFIKPAPEGSLSIGPTGLEIVPNVKQIVEKFRKDHKQIFFLCDEHVPFDKEFDRFPQHALRGTWGQAIIDELKMNVTEDVYVPKQRYNGFYETGLDAKLVNRGFTPENTDVVVVGCCTSICVMDSVGWLANMGYDITVVKNAVADFDQEMHAFALKRMERLYGAIII